MTANRTRDRGGAFPLWVDLGRVADAAWGRLCFLERTVAVTCRPSYVAAGAEVACRPFAAGRERPVSGSLQFDPRDKVNDAAEIARQTEV